MLAKCHRCERIHLDKTEESSYFEDMTSRTYDSTTDWKTRQALLPEPMRLTTLPREEWVTIGRFDVHLDVHGNDNAPATLVLLHGGGGNGRLLAHYGQVAAEAGFRAVAPDLPGYGLTLAKPKRKVVYNDWREVAAGTVEHVARKTGRPVVVLGLSMGGMLAWDSAVLTGQVAEVVVTCLMDPRRRDVQRRLVRWAWMAPLVRATFAMHALTDPVPVPMGLTSNMAGIANNPAVTRSIVRDRRAGGTWMPGRWVRTYMNAEPTMDPAEFRVCPVTMAHPAEDRWTTPDLSVPFLESLTEVKTRYELLQRSGHFPLEEPGRSRLDEMLLEALVRAI